MFELKVDNIVNVWIHVKLSFSLFGWFTFVEMRLLSEPARTFLFSFIYLGDHVPGPS